MANQNVTQLPQQTGSADTSSLLYAVRGGTSDSGLPLTVLFNSPNITGTPTIAGYLSISTAASTYAPITGSLIYAPIVGPTFTGVPRAPTAALHTPGTQLATVGFVINELSSPPAIGQTLPNGAAFVGVTAGSLALTEAGNLTNTLQVVNTSSNGANIKLIGNGGTTPNKTIRSNGGNFQILNNAYSSAILTLDDGGNLTATGAIAASQTGGIVGTTAANNANAGSVGETPAPTNLSLVPLTSATAANVSSIVLTAGDWDVSGSISYNPAGTTVISTMQSSVVQTSAVIGGLGNTTVFNGSGLIAGFTQIQNTPVTRILLAATTTVYLTAYAGFTTSTCTATGFLRARRMR